MSRRAEEEDLGINAEESRLKYDAEEPVCLKAEEEAQIAEETRLKSEDHKCARMEVEEEVLLTIEVRRQAE